MNNLILPNHVAIIMDGNGRWAKKRFLPRIMGHIKGVKRVKEIVQYSSEIGVKYLTLFAFGRENWKRPEEEVSFLMKLLYEKLNNEFQDLINDGIKITFIGDRSRLPINIIKKIHELEDATLNNQKLNLQIAVDYSGSFDIIQAVNKALNLKIKTIDEESFANLLLTSHIPNPDLLIRTSGETRTSNFMLFQISYSELYFTKTLWPDFTKSKLNEAIQWFQTKERRYGMTSEQINK